MQTNNGTTLLKLRFLTDFRSFRIFPLLLVHSRLTSYNPSIAAHGEAFFFSVRHSNVIVAGNRRHFGFTTILAENARDAVSETSFGVLRLPDWGKPLDCTVFKERAQIFEDIRIFEHDGRWLGLGCKPETEIIDGAPRFAGSSMHLIFFDREFRVAGSVGLPSPYRARWEKNWVPFHRKDGLHLVYRPSPLVVFSLDFERRQMLPVFQGQESAASGPTLSQTPWAGLSQISWSGSSQIVPYGREKYLGVIHRKFVYSDELIFEHAFVRIDDAFQMEISQPFHLMSFGMEFCAGLVVRENDVVLSFGSHGDSRSYIATLGRDDVDSLFRQAG